MNIDEARLVFDADSMWALNLCIGLIMFGVAIDLKRADFRRVVEAPRAPMVGLLAQFVLLPAATFVLTLILRPQPSIALGMMVVAACPGGNLSNFVTYLAKGNAALSIGMTVISTIAAIAMTPLNITIWGNLNPATAPIMRAVSLDPVDVFQAVVTIIGIPLVCGLLVSYYAPGFARRAKKPFKFGSVLFFLALVGFIFSRNADLFIAFITAVAMAVVLHNAVAFATGYGLARLMRLPSRDRRAVTIEVGIQNSALALSLIFGFFDGLGGMAIVAGAWGIWHIISGLALAGVWSRIDDETAAVSLDALPEEAG